MVTGPSLSRAPGGNRTPDPRIRRPLLYPLSYWGKAQFSVALPQRASKKPQAKP